MVEVFEDSKYKKYFLERFDRKLHPVISVWEENCEAARDNIFDKTKFKDEAISELKRSEGNELIIQKGDIYGAILLFTESAAYAENDSILIAKAFGNRSAASFEGGLYPECIKDIELAFKHGYPEKDSYKLLIRQAAAYNFLNKKSELKKTIRKIIELDPNSTEEKINNVLKEKERKERIIESYYSEKLPSVAYGKSSEAPCASSALRIEYDDKYGRYLVATRDIKMGDTLIVEESYSNFLLHHSRYNHCNYCFKHCITLFPCDMCTWAMFCSEKCFDEANKLFHKEECVPISKLLLSTLSLQLGNKFLIPYAMRTLAKIGYKNCQPYIDRMNSKEPILSKEEKRSAGFVNGVYDSANFETIFNLQDHFEKEAPNNIKATSGEAQVVIRCLGFDLNDEYTVNFAALYMKLRLNHYINSALPITEDVVFLDNIDVSCCGEVRYKRFLSEAYFPYHHLIAHSCAPNVASYINGKTIITYATEPIYKGEKLFINYAAIYEIYKTLSSRKIIKDSQHFICNCEMCKRHPKGRPEHPSEDPDSVDLPAHIWELTDRLLLTKKFLYDVLKSRNDRKAFIKNINQNITIRNDFAVQHYTKYKYDFRWLRVRFATEALKSLKGNLIVVKNSSVKYPCFDFVYSFNEKSLV